MGYGKKVDAPGEDENTEYNHKAVKASAGRISKVDGQATDYSIPGKKRSRKDFD